MSGTRGVKGSTPEPEVRLEVQIIQPWDKAGITRDEWEATTDDQKRELLDRWREQQGVSDG